MIIVNILYVTFIVVPLWTITNILWLLTDILLLLTKKNIKGVTWRNFRLEVQGALMGFRDNFIEIKDFY